MKNETPNGAATSKQFEADINICKCSHCKYDIPTRAYTVHQSVNSLFFSIAFNLKIVLPAV